MKKVRYERTPLQRVVGIDVAEEIYDTLPMFAQYILDLKIEGYTEKEIAQALGVSQSRVSEIFHQSRHFLIKSKLRLILDTRIFYRETHTTVLDKGD